MADVGTEITFQGDGFEYAIGRRPGMYPEANQERLFPYYSGIAALRESAFTGPLPAADGENFSVDQRQVIRPANWKHGAEVEIIFPGGIPPQDSSVSSVPMPLKAEGADTIHALPGAPDGVMLSWNGPLYDAEGEVTGEGEIRRCLTFADTDYTPDSPEDCLKANLPDPSEGTAVSDVTDRDGNLLLTALKGQMYTGPWSSDTGVTFTWPESAEFGPNETVVIGVRLLGEVDLDSEYKQIARIPVTPTSNTQKRWNMYRDSPIYGYIHPDAEMPFDTVYREPLACESEANGDFEWEPDPTLYREEGNPDSGYIVSLQGEPTHTVAETICNAPTDTNSFTITAEDLRYALDYGELHGAAGAVFYFARTTTKNLDTPPVRDRYGNRKDISDVRVLTSSVKVGRFWWDR